MAETDLQQEKQLTLGLLAHVDAGKTTLAEAILYTTGKLRQPGRVDRGDTAMDTHELERSRGITIFLSQAQFRLGDWTVSLLDTPGHVDFSSETERVLQVLDGAILVISGLDGVQAHTRTLWRLLEHYRVPVYIFVTKMAFARRRREDLLGLLERLGSLGLGFHRPESVLRHEDILDVRVLVRQVKRAGLQVLGDCGDAAQKEQRGDQETSHFLTIRLMVRAISVLRYVPWKYCEPGP